MASIFTKIINGEIPSYKILENDKYFSFLDINPLKKGHTLIISKKEVDDLFDLDDEILDGMLVFAKKVAAGIKKSVSCKKVAVLVLGLEVPHAHIHLIPIDKESETHFSNPKLKFSQEEFIQIADQIKSNL